MRSISTGLKFCRLVKSYTSGHESFVIADLIICQNGDKINFTIFWGEIREHCLCL